MPKPSEPTERDRELARQVGDKKGPTKRVLKAIAHARAEGYAAGFADGQAEGWASGAEEEAVNCVEHEKKARERGAREEREAILADLSTDFWSASSPVTWTTLVELKKRIEARGKEGEG